MQIHLSPYCPAGSSVLYETAMNRTKKWPGSLLGKKPEFLCHAQMKQMIRNPSAALPEFSHKKKLTHRRHGEPGFHEA